ncbi:MAG: hypothetical protein LQ347_002487 [Umbilicaria vellea]|nr:MAG: hypothetical protein LQ347_002487 [Umbilicaria vellea]
MPIGPGQKSALLEAFRSAVSLIPEDLRSGFVLIGGTSLLSVGSERPTEDVDCAVTGPALHAFVAAATHDHRFRKGPMENWVYVASSGINVPLEFLAQGGGFVPIITAARQITASGGVRAGLGELAVMKAKTWLVRDELSDMDDFKFLLTKMMETGEGFGVLQSAGDDEIGDVEALTLVGEEVGGVLESFILKQVERQKSVPLGS